MKTEDEIINSAISTLESALAADPRAISRLMHIVTPCNRSLADHPTVQVNARGKRLMEVGAIGLINGIIEDLTGKRIAYVFDDADPSQVIGFCLYKNPDETKA